MMEAVASSPARTASSPSANTSPNKSQVVLTPRSKIRAMLSALDEADSDKENQATSEREALSKPSTVAPAAFPRHQFANNFENNTISGEAHQNTYSQEYRALARVSSAPSDFSEDELQSPTNENAYERVRRQLKAPESSSSTNTEFLREEDEHIDESTMSASLSAYPERDIDRSKAQMFEDANANQAESARRDRFQALLSRKRKEAEERDNKHTSLDYESEDSEPLNTTPLKKQRKQALIVESETDDDRKDREIAKRLTQQARPTRKASKKALEEMSRETQRMSRNMQLTHEARTKTKFTTHAFLAKFNFPQPSKTTTNQAGLSANASSSSGPATSDAESTVKLDTPPSSPPSHGKSPTKPSKALAETEAHSLLDKADPEHQEESLDIKSSLAKREPAESGTAPAKDDSTTVLPRTEPPREVFSIRRFAKSAKRLTAEVDLEDDLEIIENSVPDRLKAFRSLPAVKAKESKSLHNLRLLAHLLDGKSYQSKDKKKSMSSTELRASLYQRAKKQARAERDEKIQRLKEKGVIVQTAEEREREQMQLDNMLEKARKEGEELAKREKDAAKREGKQDENDILDSDDEDEEYVDADDEAEQDISGSDDDEEEEEEKKVDDDDEEEEEEEEEEASENDGTATPQELELERPTNEADTSALTKHTFFNDEAEEKDEKEYESEDDKVNDPIEHETPKQVSVNGHARLSRKRVILSDDEEEDDDDHDETAKHASHQTPAADAKTPKQAAADIFGFTKMHSPALRLSQVFAGTMAESQTQADADLDVHEDHDSLAVLRGLPPPDLPNFTTPTQQQSPSIRIKDSQERQTPGEVESQYSVLVKFDTRSQSVFGDTEVSEMPDPTQDMGFQIIDSQAPTAAASYSTMDTQPLQYSSEEETKGKRNQGRLVRKHDVNNLDEANSDFLEADISPVVNEDLGSTDAFQIMRKASKHPVKVDEFDKKKSEAKDMFEEQAEESEDEYAGLGGASDDESDAEADEDMKKLINDEDGTVTDERDIAAYYAEKERIDDEKGIEQLYKDVINGGLRRKRGADHDLWESDDEDEIAARRRAAKQREFVKMRKALLADEKLGKIAQNPKREAFLQAIEDRDDIDELNFLDGPEEDVSQVTDSQGGVVTADAVAMASAPANINKRKYSNVESNNKLDTQPSRSNHRRAGKKTKPTTLADIRNTLSEMIGEPSSIIDSEGFLYESPQHSENDEEGHIDPDVEAQRSSSKDALSQAAEMPPPPIPLAATNPRRTAPDALRTAVIDRMALKRAASSSSNSNGDHGKSLAFQSSSKSGASGFHVPSLLRRASTNGSTASNTSLSDTDRSSASASADAGYGGLGGKENVKMGGTKKSSVNYYVREKERRARIDQAERERQQGKERIGKMRRTAVLSGFGALVGGRFE